MENNNMMNQNDNWSMYQPATSPMTMPQTMQRTPMSLSNPQVFMNNSSQRNMNNPPQPTGVTAAGLLANNTTDTSCLGGSCSFTPETVSNTDFFPAYLRKFIGYWARIDFLVGNNIEEHVGQILEVGASYVLIKVLEPETIMLCDLFSIKFVTIILDEDIAKLYSF